MHLLPLFFIFLTIPLSWGQTGVTDEILQHLSDDLSIGSDIFSNFNEDVESSQILEDERFYRFGRFYSFNLGLGLTSFLGNRGNAYDDKLPSFHLSFNYFFNFRSSFVFGVELSNHKMDINYPAVLGDVGRVDISFIRPFIGYRYYFDTQNLGAIFTYSNPYFTTRFEYWYQKNKFDTAGIDDDTGGGIGAGVGFGVELPLKIKERYLGIEALFHPVSLFDANTKEYQHSSEDNKGFKDLSGSSFSLMITINETW